MLFEAEEDEAAREAAEFVRGMLPAPGTYSDRQRCARALATALGRSAGAVTALTAHLAHTTLMRSLLRLVDDAQHNSDTFTAEIVLGDAMADRTQPQRPRGLSTPRSHLRSLPHTACLTNLSGEESGRGLALVVQELVTVAPLLVR